jgi:hypothetical protein
MWMKKRAASQPPAPASFERRLRAWAEITELCLGMRGSTILGDRRARSWRACVRAGLGEARRLADQEHRER